MRHTVAACVLCLSALPALAKEAPAAAVSPHDEAFTRAARDIFQRMPALKYGKHQMKDGACRTGEGKETLHLVQGGGVCGFVRCSTVLEVPEYYDPGADVTITGRPPALNPLAFDADGRGNPAVVCPVLHNSDGTANWHGLAVAYRRADGQLATLIAPDILGDRVVEVELAELAGGGFSVEYLRHGQGQAMADAPAELVRKEFRIRDGQLRETAQRVTPPGKSPKRITVVKVKRKPKE